MRFEKKRKKTKLSAPVFFWGGEGCVKLCSYKMMMMKTDDVFLTLHHLQKNL
jgi:hypothetical protein